MATIQPAMPIGSDAHVPEFITNRPDPKTGQPMPDTDGDVHGTVFPVIDRVVDRAQHDGDMGRLS